MSMKKKAFSALITAVVITTAFASAAHADQYSQNSTSNVTIDGGVGPRFDTDVPSGSYPTLSNFGTVHLNGTPQLTSATIAPFTVIDDSGAGVGWNVGVVIPDFSDGAGHTLAAAGVSMNAPTVVAGTGGSSMGGVSTHAFTDFTQSDNTDPAYRKIVVADPTDAVTNGGAPTVNGVTVSGMGTYLVSPQIVKLIVPVNTYAVPGGTTYSTTATIAIISGP